MTNALDTPISLTIFPNHFGKMQRKREISLREFADEFEKTHRADKADSPVVKLQTFGKNRTDKDCLRNNENVRSITGIEIDYDADGEFAGDQKITLQDAHEIFERANVAALIYPTWSYSEKNPSWRALLPCAVAHDPGERDRFVARVNGLFGGRIDQHASFTLSQAMYFGRYGDRKGKTMNPRARLVDGRFIDKCADLDKGALPKQTTPEGDKVRDETGSGTLMREARAAARQGLGKEEFAENLSDAAAAHVARQKDGDRAIDRAWDKASESAAKERDAVLSRFKDHGVERDRKKRARGLTSFAPGQYDAISPSFDFIPGMLQDHSVAMIYGPPQSGKTFFAIHLLCSTALGRKVFNRTPEIRRGYYIGLEGEAGVKTRIQAWCAHNHIDESPIHYALGTLDILDEEQRADLIAYMREHRIQFVVIDTLSRTITGADENVAKEMSPVIDALLEIKNETGACVAAITHTGKDVAAGIRGWSGQLGASDTTIEISAHTAPGEDPRADTPRTARVRKQKDIEPADPVSFALARHDTGVRNARGEIVRSVAVDEHERFADLTQGGDAPKPPTKRVRDALATLDALKVKMGRAGVTDAQFRKALKRADWGPENPEHWRKAFNRLLDDLESRGVVFDSNGELSR